MLRDSVLARKGARGRGVLLLGSVVIHAGFAVGLIIWSFVHVDEVKPPSLTLVWNGPRLPTLAPPGPINVKMLPGEVKGPKRGPGRVRPTLTQPPVEVDKTPRVAPAPATPPDDDNGDDSDIDVPPCTGPDCGDTRCTGPDCGDGTPCTGPDCGTGGGGGGGGGGEPEKVEMPKNLPHELTTDVVYRVDPRIPDSIKSQHAGTVKLVTARLCIDGGGRVTQATVFRGIDGADDIIRDALRTWRYKPQPVPVCFPVNLEYSFE